MRPTNQSKCLFNEPIQIENASFLAMFVIDKNKSNQTFMCNLSIATVSIKGIYNIDEAI